MKLKSIQPIKKEKECPIPYFDVSLQAGFPSPADDFSKERLDISELLVQHPAATFYVKVEGDSMEGAQITSGDLLVVDRALTAKPGSIIVALVNGEFTVKRFDLEEGRVILRPENPKYPVLEITQGCDFQVWGVVTYVIHRAC